MGTPLGRGGGGTHHGLVMSQTWFSDRQEGDLYVGSNSVSAPAQCVLVMEDLTWPYLGIEEREGCIRCSCTVKRLRSPHYSTLLKFSLNIVLRAEIFPSNYQQGHYTENHLSRRRQCSFELNSTKLAKY